jgi:hypothetical protein
MKILKDLRYYVVVFAGLITMALVIKPINNENERKDNNSVLDTTSVDSGNIRIDESLEDSIMNALKH